MTIAALTIFLAKYGLLLLLPLAVVEGPLISVLAGALAANGVIAWYGALPLLILGDLIGDLLYYAIGRLSDSRLHHFAVRLGIPVHRAEAFTARVAARSTYMLLIGKWTHAIGALVLIAAGAARVGLARFMVVNLLATVPKSALLFFAGSYAGAHLAVPMSRFGLGTVILLVLNWCGQAMQVRNEHVDLAL